MAEQVPGRSPGLHAARDAEDDGAVVRRRSELLRRCGFQQSQVPDPDTGRPAWMWARVWQGIRDAVIANSDGALAYRVWDADFDPSKPFLIEKDITIWSAIGSFLEVSGQLLTQEPPLARSHFPSRTRHKAADQSTAMDEANVEPGGAGALAPTGSD